MDRQIETRTWTRKRLSILLLLAALAACVAALLIYLSTPRMRVERDKLIVDTVRRGTFQEYILPSGEVRAGSAGPEVRALVGRHEAPRLEAGQRGETEIGGRTYPLEIARIGPAGGLDVEVDLRFTGVPPAAAAPGSPLYVRLPLGEPGEAVLLNRGAFFQATGGHWVWVVDAAGRSASRREVRLGRQNPEEHEVLSGLAPGERVITSTYDPMEGAEELVLAQ
ncbi:MAG TPA: hypothetical protein VKM72_02660 [Thermoanaerobaculia bacterium]|nr:hypothetical protein [Thermoanaerobaculia bacterium]